MTGRRVLVGMVVIALVGTAAWLYVRRSEPQPEVAGLARNVPAIFGEAEEVPPGPTKAMYSVDGARLAVIEQGRVAVVEEGRLRYVTEPGTRVVDVAWFGTSDVLLVAEGPVPTGGVVLVERDGDVRGTLQLKPSITFGSGWGMAVAPGNRRAVVTATERPPLAPTDERQLVLVDLTNGGSRPLTPRGGDDEYAPFFASERHVLYTDGERVALLDVESGERLNVASRGRALGVVRGQWLAYVDGGTVRARAFRPEGGGVGDDDESVLGGVTTLGDVPEDATAIAVDPAGARVLVMQPDVQPDGTVVNRMRAIRIRAVPTASR